MNQQGKPDKYIWGNHSRGYLPHLKKEGGTYFVTIRLHGTLPSNALRSFREQRREALDEAQRNANHFTRQQRQKLYELFSTQVDSWLDAGTGACWLTGKEIATMTRNAILHFKEIRYNLPAWVIMPNHVHTVIHPLAPYSLSQILHSWKSFTGSKANELLGRKNEPFWHKESYDHWIRNQIEEARWISYTEWNPVQAGLCQRPQDWPWSSAWIDKPQ